MEAGAALRRLGGGLLIAAGILIALSCGLCTGYFGIVSVGELLSRGDGGTLASTSPFLLAGVVASALGVGIALLGYRMVRGPKLPPRPERDR